MNTNQSPDRFIVKPCDFHFPGICSALIVLVGATVTHASLVPTVFVDTPTQLSILWDWDEFSGAGSHGAGVPIVDLNVPILVNWDVVLTTTPSGVIPTWTVNIEAIHVTPAPPGDVASLTRIFDDDQFLGLPVLPDVIESSDHPSAGHIDTYQMQVFHSSDGTINTIKLLIPEPSTLGLLGVGSLMLVGRRRRSTKRRL